MEQENVPRTYIQGIAFVLGFAFALYLSPLRVTPVRAETSEAQLMVNLEQALHAEVNAQRAAHHLIPLRRAGDLDRVARAHSSDMAGRNYMSHVNPEGANPLDRIQGAGLSGFTLAAENLGRTDRRRAPASEIVRAWLASPVHRENLLAPQFNTTGIGVTRSPDGALLFTQLYVTYPR